jgi:hypothetical protein
VKRLHNGEPDERSALRQRATESLHRDASQARLLVEEIAAPPFTPYERGDTAQRTNLAGNHTASTLIEAYGRSRFNNGRGEPFDGFMARFGYWRSTTAGLLTAHYRIGRWRPNGSSL